MNAFRFKGGILTDREAAALNEIARVVERLEPKLSHGDQPTYERIRVKLTAQNGASPPVYTGTEQSFKADGTPENKPNGRTFSPSTRPIYERNGKTVSAAGLTSGYHCWVERRTLVNGVPYYEFEVGEPTAGMFTARDSSTVVSTISELVFPDTALAQSGAAALVNDASASTSGLVNLTADQWLGQGRKKVQGLYSTSLIEYDDLSNNYAAITTVALPFLGTTQPGLYLNTTATQTSFAQIAAHRGALSSELQLQAHDRTTVPATPSVVGLILATESGSYARCQLQWFNPDTGGVPGQPQYGIYDFQASNMANGASNISGTPLLSFEVRGGIVISGSTTITSAAISNFTEAAQDASGAALTDTATVDLTYDDPNNQIKADVITQMSITADASGLKLSGDAASPGNDFFYGTSGAGTKGWNAFPQCSDVGALTDNSGGTANTTIEAMNDPTDSPASADALRDDIVANLLPAIRNNIADLAAQVNAIRTALRGTTPALMA